MMRSGSRSWVVVTTIAGLLSFGCGDGGGAANPVAPTPRPGGPAVLVGAGDIAECGVPGSEATALLLDAIPGTVFTAGDNAYYNGTLDEFQRCYAPTWGRHKARTRPIPGNHDYGTPGASGYYSYFGAAAAPEAPGYYSYDVGGWQVIALNSNIPLDAASPQLAWLGSELSARRSACTLAYVHHPLFTSGPNGPDARLRPIWDVLHAAGVEVVVSGHDHHYERFAPQDPSGRPDLARGVRQFVAGTGGAHLYPVGAPRPNSEARASVWGVLKFTLHSAGYDWEFIPVAGQTFRDFGSAPCH
ncbi:MAG: metallophosphoesterase [Acidobacteria bacterium]|nr:metallophosphoesterase [Acidobacteriota bacterium]